MSLPSPDTSPAPADLTKLYVRVRADLLVTRQTHQDRLYYVIKDPVSLRYFRVSEVEHAIFSMLDGKRNLAEVLAAADQRYPHIGLEAGDVIFFVNQLKNVNFLETVAPQQGALLYERARLKRKMKSLWRQVRGILYIKIPLWDPDRLFDRVVPSLRFLWSRWSLALLCLGFLSAIWIVVNNWSEMEFSLSALISPSSLLYFWVALVIRIVVHEMSHGLTTKHYGGEVHEMGFLLLVLTPCLYCNTSDAYTFQNRWKRFATSFAGIFADLAVASWAAILWWLSAPGVFNSLMYRLMFLAGVTALLINGNPLMRFDGYYILSDLLGMPNLRSNSFRYLKVFLRRYVLGMPVPGAEISGRAHQIQLFYGAAASLWLVSVLIGICIAFLIKLPALGIWITLSTVYGMVLRPAGRLVSYLQDNREYIPLLHWPRVLAPLAVAGLLVYLLGFLPLEGWVEAPCVILPEERVIERVGVSGFLEEVLVEEGDQVTPGQPLARLTNPTLSLQLASAEKAVELVDLQIAQALGFQHPVLAGVLRETRAAHLAQRRQLGKEVERLIPQASISGTVLTPRLDWLQGAYFERGSGLCEVGALGTMLARIVVNERDLAGLAEGDEAHVRLRTYPDHTFSGEVRDISPRALEEVPDVALSSQAGGEIPTYRDARSRQVPTVQLFELTIQIANADGRLRPGMTGWAKIEGPSRTIAGRLSVRLQKGLKTSFRLR